MSERNADWHARHQRGETFSEIARSAGTTRNAVSGGVDRHKRQLAKIGVDGRRKTNGPTRAERRAAAGPVMPKTPKRQACDPASVQRFQEAVDRHECLWWDGDLRDGSAAFCGHARVKGRYCHDHHARVIDNRPKKSVAP